MLCLQAFLFLIELRHLDGFVSDCFYDDLGEGSGASPIPFPSVSRCYFHGTVVDREAIGSTPKALS